MNASLNNATNTPINILTAKQSKSTAAQTRTSSTDVTTAVSELRNLWETTGSHVRSSRESLYDFLGRTYELSRKLEGDCAATKALKMYVCNMHTKVKGVARKSPAELLLVASMGAEQFALRSKYKRLFLNATTKKVPPDSESFKDWLETSGGLVKALVATVESTFGINRDTRPKATSLVALKNQLLSAYAQFETEERIVDAQYDGFTVVLFHRKPGSTCSARVASLSDKSIIRRAMMLAMNELAEADSAA